MLETCHFLMSHDRTGKAQSFDGNFGASITLFLRSVARSFFDQFKAYVVHFILRIHIYNNCLQRNE